MGLVRVVEKGLEGDIDSGWVEVVRSVQNLRRRSGSTRLGRVTRTAGNHRRAARRWRMVETGVADGRLRRWGRRNHGEHHPASYRPTFCATQTQPRSGDNFGRDQSAGRHCVTVLAGPCAKVSKIVAPNRCARRRFAASRLGAADSAVVGGPLVERVAQLGGVGIRQADFAGDSVDSEGDGLVGLGGAV